jgi:uncharacterized membrane protein YgcG
MSPVRVLAAVLPALLLLVSAPASARESYVQDGAHMLSQATIDDINAKVGAFNAQTGKEVVVVTVASLGSTPINDAVERSFAENQVNGVLIFLAKDEKQGRIVGDKAARAFFPQGTYQNIYDAMRGYLRTGDYDGAVKTGVNLSLDQYRSHQSSLNRAGGAALGAAVQAPVSSAEQPRKSSVGGSSLIWLLVFLVIGFFVIRAIFRAISGPRQAPPGYGGPLPGPGPMPGPGFGGYGPGYGQQGGGMGGGFLSGMLGGLGGAFLGNELFGRRNDGGGMFGGGESQQAGMIPGTGQDASGWQPDAGQIDTGNMGGGTFGDSGGGGWGDAGGGWGDSGGGDSGGGGGDGGW